MKKLILATAAVVSLSSMVPVTAEPLILNKPRLNTVAYCDSCGPQYRCYRSYCQPPQYYYYFPQYYRPYYYHRNNYWW